MGFALCFPDSVLERLNVTTFHIKYSPLKNLHRFSIQWVLSLLISSFWAQKFGEIFWFLLTRFICQQICQVFTGLPWPSYISTCTSSTNWGKGVFYFLKSWKFKTKEIRGAQWRPDSNYSPAPLILFGLSPDFVEVNKMNPSLTEHCKMQPRLLHIFHRQREKYLEKTRRKHLFC